MHKLPLLGICLLSVLQTAPSTAAAPLDALLSANKPSAPGSSEIEAGYDVVNDTMDIFGVRDNDGEFSGTNVGDYHGAHLRAGLAITTRLWIEGALWKRRIDYRQDQADIRTWQLAGQYKLSDAAAYRPGTAIRIGAWGNTADTLEKTSPTRFGSARMDSVRVTEPEDRQYQVDLIATWPVMQTLEVTTFAGAGTSRVTIGAANGTMTHNGCHYNLEFGRTATVGTLAQPCSGNVVVERFTVPRSAHGGDFYGEAEYRAAYGHAGLSARWSSGPWRLQAGYQYQALRRRKIDDEIERRGGRAVKSNHIVIAEIAYRVTRHLSLFTRGQYMSNQFTGEIPFAYNRMTARRFEKRYGFASAGIVFHF